MIGCRALHQFIALSVCFALLAAGTGTARAEIIFQTPTVTRSGSNFDYSYPVSYANISGSSIQSGNFATAYDIAGLVSGSESFSNSNFSISVQNTGITPTNVTPIDNPSIPNITLIYNGPTINGTGGGETILGTLTFVSSIGTTATSPFGQASETVLFGSQFQEVAPFVGPTSGPNPNGGLVPEPGSLLLWGVVGMVGVCFGLRKLQWRLAA
jgi:hypothetical protein